MSSDNSVQTIEVDMRGQVCPSSLLVAMDNINRQKDGLQDGSLKLSIKTDNREATTTIPGTAKAMGYAVEVIRKEGYYQIEIISPDHQA